MSDSLYQNIKEALPRYMPKSSTSLPDYIPTASAPSARKLATAMNAFRLLLVVYIAVVIYCKVKGHQVLKYSHGCCMGFALLTLSYVAAKYDLVVGALVLVLAAVLMLPDKTHKDKLTNIGWSMINEDGPRVDAWGQPVVQTQWTDYIQSYTNAIPGCLDKKEADIVAMFGSREAALKAMSTEGIPTSYKLNDHNAPYIASVFAFAGKNYPENTTCTTHSQRIPRP